MYEIFSFTTDQEEFTILPDGRVIHIENGTMQTLCAYEWDDADASVLCRHLGMGMSGRAISLQREPAFVRTNTYGVYCLGNETNTFDCLASDYDITNGTCDVMNDAAVECDGRKYLNINDIVLKNFYLLFFTVIFYM